MRRRKERQEGRGGEGKEAKGEEEALEKLFYVDCRNKNL